MFWLTFAVLELMIATEIIIAYQTGFLFPPSSNQRSVLMEHGGIWSDMLLLSPVLALIVDRWGPRWSLKAIGTSFAVSVIVTLLMLSVWRRNPIPNCFDYGGRTLPAGWVHGAYMAVALATFILFYFTTPPDAISRQAATIISLLTAIHATISMAQPEYNTFHQVSMNTIGIIGVAWFALAVGWWHLAH